MDRIDTEHFSIPLLEWYDMNKREMVWRDHFDPYYTWISEIMLQQTRIEAAKDYFVRFTGELPDIESLAAVKEERLMKLWEGLGYYNRARNLKKAAEILVEKYGGKLPADYEELLSLPGIGPYTAGAIASIAYGIKVPAVDGNVLRVVMRYLKCGDDIAKMPVRRKVEGMLSEAMPDRPGDFNQAIMELGEVVCIPNGAPLCEKCPVSGDCQARASGCQEEYPKKAEKKPRRIEERTIFVIECEGKIGISRRPDKGLLAGLYEFPSLGEKKMVDDVKEMIEKAGLSPKEMVSMGEAKHIFSHVEWHMQGVCVKFGAAGDMKGMADGLMFVAKDELRQRYMLPVAFHFFLKQIM